MVAVEVLPSCKLLNLAKTKTLDEHLGNEQVLISKRTKLHENMEKVYQKLCFKFHHNEPMYWGELYELLSRLLEYRRIYV